MHPAAYSWLARHASIDYGIRVLELGSKDLNGSPRPLWPCATYHGIDLEPGPGVDEVADACTWRTDRRFDIVVCAEVAEHCDNWPDLLVTAAHHLDPGGMFLFTAAGTGRTPHSAVDGGPLRKDEHYRNVTAGELNRALERAEFSEWVVDTTDQDIRAEAWL